MRSEYGITPEQYHAGLDKLWAALGLTGPQDKDVFTLAAEAIADPPVYLGKLNTTLIGRIGMVICWYFDGEMGTEDDAKTVRQILRLLPRLLKGKFDRISDYHSFCLWDALGSWPGRDPEMEKVYQSIRTARVNKHSPLVERNRERV